MIRLTKMDGEEIIINAEAIEFIEEAPHTIITVTSDKKVIVEESADEIIEKTIEYKSKIIIAAR